MSMRIKASESLKKLHNLKVNKKRKYMTFADVDQDTWTQCKTSLHFGSEYVKLIAWVNNNTNGFHSRSDESFWFEDEKDAFNFKLKWGNN